jgi:hypothetical protein
MSRWKRTQLALVLLGTVLAAAAGATGASGCVSYKLSCECDLNRGVCDRDCPCDVDCKGWAVVELACTSSDQCPGLLRCVNNQQTADSWCGGSCSQDSDCGGNDCCLATGPEGNFCFPARLCVGLDPGGADDGDDGDGQTPGGSGPPVVGGGNDGGGADGGTGSPDASVLDPDAVTPGPADGGSPSPDAPVSQPPAGSITCAPAATPNGTGHHNAGQDCLSCHSSLDETLRWTVAGTLFDAVTGGGPVGGATVTVIDADGQRLDLVTASNGNFWTAQPVTMPLRVAAGSCPDLQKMNGMPSTGSCNSSGCHTAAFRVHLP